MTASIETERRVTHVTHPLVHYLDSRSNPAQFQELALLLYDQAALAEGVPLGNPPEFVQRLNRLLVRLAAPAGGDAASGAAS